MRHVAIPTEPLDCEREVVVFVVALEGAHDPAALASVGLRDATAPDVVPQVGASVLATSLLV
jgi:hypothetical protein